MTETLHCDDTVEFYSSDSFSHYEWTFIPNNYSITSWDSYASFSTYHSDMSTIVQIYDPYDHCTNCADMDQVAAGDYIYAGSWTIRVTLYDSGQFYLKVACRPRYTPSLPPINTLTFQGTIECNDTIHNSLESTETHYWNFNLSSYYNEFIVDITDCNSPFDTSLYVYNSTGDQLNKCYDDCYQDSTYEYHGYDSCGFYVDATPNTYADSVWINICDYCTSHDSFIFSEFIEFTNGLNAGIYYVAIKGNGAQQYGDYSITINCTPSPILSATDSPSISPTITPPLSRRIRLPPFWGVQFLPYGIVLIVLTGDLLIKLIQYIGRKRKSAHKNHQQDVNCYETDLRYVQMTDLDNDEKEEITSLNAIDETNLDSIINKSPTSIAMLIAEIGNTTIWMIYFEHFTSYDNYSPIWVLQLCCYIIHALWNLYDIIRHLFCKKYNKIHNHEQMLMGDNFKYLFLSLEIVFKFVYSVDKLDQFPTFYSLTFSFANTFKSMFMVTINYTMEFMNKIQGTMSVSSDDNCCQKFMKILGREGFKQTLALIFFVSINVITFGFYILGFWWIIIYSVIWLLMPVCLYYFTSENLKNINLDFKTSRCEFFSLSLCLLCYFGGYYVNLLVGIYYLMSLSLYRSNYEFCCNDGAFDCFCIEHEQTWLYGISTVFVYVVYLISAVLYVCVNNGCDCKLICLWFVLLVPLIFGLLPPAVVFGIITSVIYSVFAVIIPVAITTLVCCPFWVIALNINDNNAAANICGVLILIYLAIIGGILGVDIL
eukprot:223925_1